MHIILLNAFLSLLSFLRRLENEQSKRKKKSAAVRDSSCCPIKKRVIFWLTESCFVVFFYFQKIQRDRGFVIRHSSYKCNFCDWLNCWNLNLVFVVTLSRLYEHVHLNKLNMVLLNSSFPQNLKERLPVLQECNFLVVNPHFPVCHQNTEIAGSNALIL